MAGIPDICTRNKYDGYEESYFDLKKKNKTEEIKQTLKDIKYRLSKINCTVIYVTITTMSFQKWNAHRFNQGKTHMLLHTNEYESMQEKLNTTIHEINKYITQLNKGSHMFTPFLHTYVHRIKNKVKFSYLYYKLIDRVHPSDKLAEQWQNQLLTVMKKNELSI